MLPAAGNGHANSVRQFSCIVDSAHHVCVTRRRPAPAPDVIESSSSSRYAGRCQMRLLLVEDQADAARVIAKGLREQAYAVDVAADGEAAEHEAAIHDYDAIILDVMLPRRSGIL